MGVSQSIFKIIKSEIIRIPRLQSLRLYFVVVVDLDSGRRWQKGCENEGCVLSGCRYIDMVVLAWEMCFN